jgi:hypothetical protein
MKKPESKFMDFFCHIVDFNKSIQELDTNSPANSRIWKEYQVYPLIPAH